MRESERATCRNAGGCVVVTYCWLRLFAADYISMVAKNCYFHISVFVSYSLQGSCVP